MNEAVLAAVVALTIAIMQGLIELIKFLFNKYSDSNEEKVHMKIIENIKNLEEKIETADCGLTEQQAFQLSNLHEMHSRYDTDGTPMWYVPRSWSETQKEIVDKLQIISEVNMKMLGIIERLERRLD